MRIVITLFSLVNLIVYGFIATTILLYISYFLLVRKRQIIEKLLVISAVFLIAGASLYFISTIGYLLYELFLVKKEGLALHGAAKWFFGRYWYYWWIIFAAKGIVPQILWWKRFRKSIWVSVVLIPFLMASILLPAFCFFMVPTAPDYLSVKDLHYTLMSLAVSVIPYGFLLTIVYFFIRNKR
jgi:hypothetical protein